MLAIVLIIPCAVLFTGCGAKGTYEVESASVAGITLSTREEFEDKYGRKFDYEEASTAEKIESVLLASVYCKTLELAKDGKVIYGFDAPKWWPEDKEVEESEASFTWKEEEDGSIGFYVGDVKTGDATYEDGKITIGGVVYAKKGLF